MGSTALGRIGGSGGGGSKITITQPGHDFIAGNVVRYDASNDQYTKAIASEFGGFSADVNAEAIGVVESVSVDTFTMVLNGKIESGSFTVENFDVLSNPQQGEFYFLSDETPGLLTNVPPQDGASIRKPIFIQTTTGGIGFVQNYIGIRNSEILEDIVDISSIQPVGMIAPFGGIASAIPDGWLPCDGSIFDPSEYPELATAIGLNYGGNEYRLPDLRGRVALGTNPTGGNATLSVRELGSVGGEESVVLERSNLPNHNHDGSSYKAFIDDVINNEVDYANYGAVYGFFDPDGPTPTRNIGENSASVPVQPIDDQGAVVANDWVTHFGLGMGDDYDYALTEKAVNIASEGSDLPHNNMPPFQVVNWIIRARATEDAAIITVNLRNLRDVDTSRGFPTNNNQKNGDLVSWNSTEQKFIMRPDTATVNYCQNGAFDKWTNGITFNDAAFTAAYTANNWYYERTGTVGGTDRLFQIERGGAVPGHNAANSFQGLTEPIAGHDFVPSAFNATGVTGDSLLIRKIQPLTTSLFSNDEYHTLSFFVNGRDYAQLLQAEWFTLSFWSWTPQAYFTGDDNRAISVSFRNQAGNGRTGRRFVDEFRPIQNQWTKHEIKVPVDAIQQWNFQETEEPGSHGLKVTFALSAGSGRRTQNPRTWAAGLNIYATDNQAEPINDNVSVGSYWLGLAQVQLEAGAYSSNFKLPQSRETNWKPQISPGVGQLIALRRPGGNGAPGMTEYTFPAGKWVYAYWRWSSGNDNEYPFSEGQGEAISDGSTPHEFPEPISVGWAFRVE